ncbi:MAG: helix-turn-helix domain-containing protein [Gordonia sp. (in: high G+C Gram-positive bacteria)]
MPKISDEQRRVNETRFVDAARRCFTRHGVESTSMEQIRSEADVSSGLMYRYFPSKDALIHAAIAGSMLQFDALISQVTSESAATSPAGYLEELLTAAARFRRHTDGVDLFVLAVQGWAYAQTRPTAKALVAEGAERQLALYRAAAALDSDDVARAVAGALAGFIVQSTFTQTEIDVHAYCAALGELGRSPAESTVDPACPS